MRKVELMAAGLVSAMLPAGTTQAADTAGPVFVYTLLSAEPENSRAR
jgi:hypothetical protein